MRAPRWEDIITTAIDVRLEDVHTAEPGWILDYDAESQTCSAQPALMKPFPREDGERGLARKPPSRNARVCFPGGIRFNLEPGDPVLIVFCSGSLDNWEPGKNRPVDPGDERMHNLSDPIVVPMGKSKEVPEAGQLIVEHDRVSLGKLGVGDVRHQVVRKVDAQAGKASIDAEVASVQAQLTIAIAGLPGTATQVAELTAKLDALTPVADAFAAMVDSISSNVEAT